MGVLNFLKFAAPGAALPKPVGGSVTYGQGESVGGSIASALFDPFSTPFDKTAGAAPLVQSPELEAGLEKEEKERERKHKEAQAEWQAEQTKKAKVPQVGSTTAGQQVAQQIQEALRRRLGL